MNGDGQWAKVPEWVAYKSLDATALNVLIIMAAKAGRDRVAWISHRTIGEGLGVHRTTVGRAVRKLTKVGVLEVVGKVIVDHDAGTWVKKYRIVDRRSDQGKGTPAVPSGRVADMASDLPEVHPGRTSVGADIAPSVGPEVHMDGPEVHIGTPEVHPGRTHSVPQYSVPQISVPLLDAHFEIERDQNHNGKPKSAAKEEGHEADVREITKTIGVFKPYDPKQQARKCRVCGKFVHHRRTYCPTHPVSEVMPLIEKAAVGEGGSQ